jgi:hypothetical protein
MIRFPKGEGERSQMEPRYLEEQRRIPLVRGRGTQRTARNTKNIVAALGGWEGFIQRHDGDGVRSG